MAEAEADYEEFLQAFERPTQIYRYLRTYHKKSPCFLQRNLLYMRVNSGQAKKPKRLTKCRLNDLRERKAVLDQSVVSADSIRSGGPLELTFLSFSEHAVFKSSEPLPSEAVVDVSLKKDGFRRSKETLGSPSHEIPLGSYCVPCHWSSSADGVGSAAGTSASMTGSMLESTVVVPLGMLGFSMLGGHGVKQQKLIFRVSFPSDEKDMDIPGSPKKRSFCDQARSSLVLSPSPSASSSPATVTSEVVTLLSSAGESTPSHSSTEEGLSPPPAKRHCVAPPVLMPVVNGCSSKTASHGHATAQHSSSTPNPTNPNTTTTTITNTTVSVRGSIVQTTQDLLVLPSEAQRRDDHPHGHGPGPSAQQPQQTNGNGNYHHQQQQQLATASPRTVIAPVSGVPKRPRLHDDPEDDGIVDWSKWNGELTQSSAAVNRKVQPLLKKNRELRGLVLDDPPNNSGLPEFSYARGRRGYTKAVPGYTMPLAPVANGNGTAGARKSQDPSPARTPTTPSASPAPSIEHLHKPQLPDVMERTYYVEVPLADDSRTCLLEEGHYEMALSSDYAMVATQHANSRGIHGLFPPPSSFSPSSVDTPPASTCGAATTSSHQQAVWESLPQPLHSRDHDLSSMQGANLHFIASWPEGKPMFVALPTPQSYFSDESQVASRKLTPSQPRPVVFNFIYNNGRRQQTDSVEKLTCPWCSVACPHIYSLLKHLQLNHPRFSFSVQSRNQAYEIDVCLNSRYGVVFDTDIHPARHCDAASLSCRLPQKRIPFTKGFIGQRGRCLKFNLKEFKVLGGASRMFFHCRTALPVLPSEMDEDSEEEESPPEWISTKMTELLQEFTDVNEGEKTMMKLWNEYILRERVNVDSEIPSACLSFTKLHASTIHRYDLQRNFLLHLSTLCDYGLIGTDCLHQCYSQIRMPATPSTPGRNT